MVNASMDFRTDDELLRRARRLDQNALAAVYDRHSDGMYYYALRLLGDKSLAEDCVAETFSRLLQVLRNGGGPNDHLKAYLYRCVHNWITDYYRRQPMALLDPENDLPNPDDNPSHEAEQNITRQRVRNAIRLLTPDQRHVVALRYIEGWDLAEIADSLQKPLGAIKSLQHRAIATLQRILLDEKKEEELCTPIPTLTTE